MTNIAASVSFLQFPASATTAAVLLPPRLPLRLSFPVSPSPTRGPLHQPLVSLLPATRSRSAPPFLSSPPTTLTYRGYLLLITEPVPPTGHCANCHYCGPLFKPKP
ncbi:hypothetical protein S83_049195 [Arachis hypogaea]